MNTEPDRVASRWVREAAGHDPSAAEQAVLGEVLKAIRRVRHGNVTLAVQDGRVVQLEVTEKKRF